MNSIPLYTIILDWFPRGPLKSTSGFIYRLINSHFSWIDLARWGHPHGHIHHDNPSKNWDFERPCVPQGTNFENESESIMFRDFLFTSIHFANEVIRLKSLRFDLFYANDRLNLSVRRPKSPWGELKLHNHQSTSSLCTARCLVMFVLFATGLGTCRLFHDQPTLRKRGPSPRKCDLVGMWPLFSSYFRQMVHLTWGCIDCSCLFGPKIPPRAWRTRDAHCSGFTVGIRDIWPVTTLA